MKQRIRPGARNQPAVIEVITIGKDFARHLKSSLLPGSLHRAIRWCKQDQCGIDCEDRFGNGVRHFLVAHCHIVERPMGLHMSSPSSGRERKRMECAYLIDQLREQLRDGNADFFSPEVFAVIEGWVCANGDAVFLGLAGGLENRSRVATLTLGRDISPAYWGRAS